MILNRVFLALLWLSLCIGGAAAQFADQRQFAGTSGGALNAQTITIPNVGAVLPQGVPFRFKPGFVNTTAATLTISGGSGAIALCKNSPAGPVALIGGELQLTSIVTVEYNGTCLLITSVTDATSSSLVTAPQGYLTPCPAASPPTGCTAGQPVPTGDVTIGVGHTVTGLVYSPVVGGNRVPIYNGSSMVMFTFPELTLTLASTHAANALYDVYVFSNAGTPTLVTGPAWVTSTAGAGDRGSGAGTTQIANVNGVWTNAVVMTGINGATTYSSIPANQATLLGTILVSGSNGVLTFTRTYGQSRVWPLANLYNKLPLLLKVGDATPNWSYNTASFRNSNGSAANSATILNVLTQEPLDVVFSQNMTTVNTAVIAAVRVAYNGSAAGFITQATTAGGGTNAWTLQGLYSTLPTLGINTIQMQEEGNAAGTNTWFGTETNNLMTAKWRG